MISPDLVFVKCDCRDRIGRDRIYLSEEVKVSPFFCVVDGGLGLWKEQEEITSFDYKVINRFITPFPELEQNI